MKRRYVYLDFETAVSKTLTLKKMTLRQYLERTHILGVAVAVDNEPTVYYTASELPTVLMFLRQVCMDPQYVVVAHNAAFDVRVLTILLGLPFPQTTHCTLELAMNVWPNHPGGYSLKNLGETLHLGAKVGEAINVGRMTPEELAEYCKQDVELCRRLHQIELQHIHPTELTIAETTFQIREGHFEIDQEAVCQAIKEFTNLASSEAGLVADMLGDEGGEVFGRDGTTIKSVKPHVLKQRLEEHLGFLTDTTSKKKINPKLLARHTEASKVINGASRINKALFHKRQARVFDGLEKIDMELGYYRAHTGRFSSPSVGKGLNLHNLPKRDKVLAKNIRQRFRLPSEYCFVRGDFANVEYRITGLLTQSEQVLKIFNENPWADPYGAFGYTATGVKVTKADPIRQVWKAAVLGLGYGMGVARWIQEMLLMLASPEIFKITEDDLEEVIRQQGWSRAVPKFVKKAQRDTGASDTVVIAAYHTHRLFHEVHPEFSRLARWLMDTCEHVASYPGDIDAARRALEARQKLPAAPHPDLIQVEVTDRFEGISVTVQCGFWPTPTVTWRDLRFRKAKNGGFCLHSVQAGTKGYRPLSPSICIENVMQSGARNGLCCGMLTLRDRYPYILSVHDEVLLIVPRTPDDVRQARDDLICTFKPGNPGWDWSVVIDPSEITVSQSFYEDESLCTPEWWANPDLENLP